MQDTTPSFFGLGIPPKILDVLTKLKFTSPTPIQEKSIPLAMEGKDVIGLAQTGTGKTLAFGVPVLAAALRGCQTLVVLPTRELAQQVEEALRPIAAPLNIKTVLVVGGESQSRQMQGLRRNPEIIIGTPGRINDLLQQRVMHLERINVLVLDEADRMLDMGFLPQLKTILARIPEKRQTLLFSATMPAAIIEIAKNQMRLPTHVEIAPPGTVATNVSQELYFVQRQDKEPLLIKLLEQYRGSVLVFMRTKFGAKKLALSIRKAGHTANEIHSNRTLGQRREALEGFKRGKYRVLVATDIAARGIDVQNIELVLNYDLPQDAEDYVHRIGRTARAGAKGHAISFAAPDQRRDVMDIERLMKIPMPRAEGTTEPTGFDAGPATRQRRGFGGNRGGAGRGPRPQGQASSPRADAPRSAPPRAPRKRTQRGPDGPRRGSDRSR